MRSDVNLTMKPSGFEFHHVRTGVPPKNFVFHRIQTRTLRGLADANSVRLSMVILFRCSVIWRNPVRHKRCQTLMC